MNNPKISIIVPVYNVEKYLDDCIKSLVVQTYKNLEIILIDDGSPDNCPQICDEWAKRDDRIKVIHKKNAGLGAARNTGILNATGDYIGFVDSDDWISSDMYEKLLKLALQKDADIACGKIIYTTTPDIKIKDNDIVHEYSQEEFSKLYFKIASNKTVHYVVNKLYRANIGRKIHFPEGMINEDVEGFFYALYNSKKIVTINHTVYFYRQNCSSISYKWFTKKQLDLLTVWEHVYFFCKNSKPEWSYWALLNYDRAHFGLLVRLALNDFREDKKYSDIEKVLVTKLREVRKDLLSSDVCLSLSRKILINMMCLNYSFTKKIIRLYGKLKKDLRYV